MALSETEKKKLVSDICEKNGATSLLEEFFKHPEDPEFGKKFSDTLNETILYEQKKTKDRSNLLLCMNRVRFIFASYINCCKNESHMSRAAHDLNKAGGSLSQIQAYQEIQCSAQKDQVQFKNEWDLLIDGKGYPSSWKDMFAEHSKLHMNSGPPSFDLEFMKKLRPKTLWELMQNIWLRETIWGEISLTDAGRKGVNSWDWIWVLESEGIFSKGGSGAGSIST
jgi:hypothetical protein